MSLTFGEHDLTTWKGARLAPLPCWVEHHHSEFLRDWWCRTIARSGEFCESCQFVGPNNPVRLSAPRALVDHPPGGCPSEMTGRAALVALRAPVARDQMGDDAGHSGLENTFQAVSTDSVECAAGAPDVNHGERNMLGLWGHVAQHRLEQWLDDRVETVRCKVLEVGF